MFKKTRERIKKLEEDHESVHKIVQHVDKHGEAYLAGAGCLVVGFVVRGRAPEIKQIIKPKQIMAVGYKSSQVMNTIVMPAKGHPGNVVQNLNTMETYASQGELARALGVAPSLVSAYFHDRIPNLKGEEYAIIGKAGHPLA